jgi:hypothetical protein
MHSYETDFCNLCDRFFATIIIEYDVEWGDEPHRYGDPSVQYPGSPDEIDVRRVVVTSLVGETWDKTREELEAGGWTTQIDAEAFECAETQLEGWLFDQLISNAEPQA